MAFNIISCEPYKLPYCRCKARSRRRYASSDRLVKPKRLATAKERLKEAIGDDSKTILTYPVDLKNKDVESQIETLLTNVNNGFGDELLDHLVFTTGDTLPYIQTKDMDVEFAQACGIVIYIASMFIG